ncbi:MAG TPA: alginate lyase family protein [Acidobacteriaceae bacterium]|nr:alginate lyase family protein [Acidobacteriaceae bacterium]
MLIDLARKLPTFALFPLLAGSAAFAASSPLQSPWDLHPVAPTSAPYACPAPIALPRDIVAFDYYADSRKSIPDPARLRAYDQAASLFNQVSDQAEKAADDYRRTGSAAAAACVLDTLDAESARQAITGSMASNQSYYVQNWILGALAVTYLKVRSSAAGTPAQRSRIEAWMVRVARSTQGYFDTRRAKQTKDGRNNHLYWAGFAVMSAGIAANDRSLYDWGLGAYRDGVRQIAANGSLPLEMARGRRALHYHLFAAAPLVTMAEFGEANGQDFYAESHGALHRLVDRCVAGLEDNSWFAQQSAFPQDTPGNRLTAADVAWLQPYAQRFPNPAIAQLLAQVRSLHVLYLGGDPPP